MVAVMDSASVQAAFGFQSVAYFASVSRIRKMLLELRLLETLVYNCAGVPVAASYHGDIHISEQQPASTGSATFHIASNKQWLIPPPEFYF